MSTKYKASNVDSAYFITITTVGWIDVFTRLSQKTAIMDSLRYCQMQKGLTVFAYCLMSNHLHLFCKAAGTCTLPEIMRDFKKFTSKKIISLIRSEPESRREWMLPLFGNACSHLSRNQQWKVWQDGYHAEEVFSAHWIRQKINYIHQNPVKQKIVTQAEDYYFSSARNYAGLEYALEVCVLL